MRPVFVLFLFALMPAVAAETPLRALLICGGCCHDYAAQSVILRDGIQSRANIQVDVVRSEDGGVEPRFAMFDGKDWAKNYDVIIHDECAAEMKEKPYIQNILDAHRGGKPAVNLHCAMHSYRDGTEAWPEVMGIHSTGHGPQKPIAVDFSVAEHEITKGLANWTTGNEELYNNIKVFGSAKPLALGTQDQGEGKKETAVVAWTNDYHGTRIFNTTLGHNNETVGDVRYLDLVVRGLLWSCGKLTPEYFKPYSGPPGTMEVVPKGQKSIAPTGAYEKSKDPLLKGGNYPPVIGAINLEQEKEILKDVHVAEGFDVSLFATSSSANYPVYVAASPSGDLYVASDGNGSLGRDPGRGRVIRLRDTDNDGRADEAKPFVKNLDSPRGMVWDNDRLYVIHPPDLSCFIDHNGDGQADEAKKLVTGIAFGFKNHPADHTTNGLSLGIDGWLYISGGDFGFMDAKGSDGVSLQHRAGGVIRVRPDGSGMHVFSTGTRNILGTPISPLLDIFSRDNTNDGGGWDVRMHHFTGLEDHGYPRLYMNFPEEIVQPIADYGGGSGCGSVYISEPGIPDKWNNAPFTCDWGSNALWHHKVEPKGATFTETRKPEALIQIKQATDADVDGMSRIYQASWKGATFDWTGPNVGFIVRVQPKNFTPAALPDFNEASDAELIALLESPSQVRTLEAQRALLRRPASVQAIAAIQAMVTDSNKPLAARVAGLYALTLRDESSENSATVIKAVAPLAGDPALGRFVLRALADVKKAGVPEEIYAAGLKNAAPRTRLEAIVGVTQLSFDKLAEDIISLLADSDAVIRHTAFQSLARLNASAACFKALDDSAGPAAQRSGALLALMRMHTPEVVQGLIERLEGTKAAADRVGIFAALCRLHFKEGVWTGDSWGTRPDTRGPYYQPTAWSETSKIAATLKRQLENVTAENAPAMIQELRRNRIESTEAMDRVMALVKKNPSLLPDLVAQLANADSISAEGVAYLVQAVDGDWPATTVALAIKALASTNSQEGLLASLAALEKLAKLKDASKEFSSAQIAFLNAPTLENHHQTLENEAAKMNGAVSQWADAALLTLSTRKDGSPESKELTAKALDHGWQDSKRRVQILKAIQTISFNGRADQILVALDDADPAVAAAAKEAAATLKLEKKGADSAPAISTMKPDQVLAEVVKTRGDVELGKQLFNRQTCSACHAATTDEAQKGPYLGNIAQTYSREVLAKNILEPQITIAQGFATEMFTLKDGSSQMGFVTLESAEEVKARNIAGQETTWKVSEILKREKLPISLMPPGLVSNLNIREFASLLDYLEALAKK